MKRTSRSSRLVRSAARSPARAITGPEVARKFTPSSRETICASVVLPRPGGPAAKRGGLGRPAPTERAAQGEGRADPRRWNETDRVGQPKAVDHHGKDRPAGLARRRDVEPENDVANDRDDTTDQWSEEGE